GRGADDGHRAARPGDRVRDRTRRRARAGARRHADPARGRRLRVRCRRLARAAPHGAAARVLSRRAEPVLIRRWRDARIDAHGRGDRPVRGGLPDLRRLHLCRARAVDGVDAEAVGAVHDRSPTASTARHPRRLGIGGARGCRCAGRLRDRDAAARRAVRRRLCRRDRRVPHPRRRAAGGVRDLDSSRHRHFGGSRTAAAADRPRRTGGQRGAEPVRHSALRAGRRGGRDGGRRSGQPRDPRGRTAKVRVTRTHWALFALLFVAYAYFYQAGGWNQNTRYALVRAITNEHTFVIDPYQLSTGDKAFDHGHYYSDKAPGLSLTAVPIVAIARPLARALGIDSEDYPGIALLSYLATVFTAGLFTAMAGVALFSLCVELGSSAAGALVAAVVFGLGTPIWTLATIFIGHAFSASLLVLAFASACRAGDGDWRRGAMAGLCAGWATVSEFPAAIPAVVIALLTLVHVWRLDRARRLRVVGALTIGALVPAAVLMAYQYACFGSPFHIGYASESSYVGMQQGFYGVDLPRMIRLRRILFGEYRGLLPLAPVLACAPVGLCLSRPRLVAVAAAVIAVYYVLLNASYAYWEGG